MKIKIFSIGEGLFEYMKGYLQDEKEEYTFEFWEKIPISEAKKLAKRVEDETEWNTRVFIRNESKAHLVPKGNYGVWGPWLVEEITRKKIICIAVEKPFAKYRRLFYNY